MNLDGGSNEEGQLAQPSTPNTQQKRLASSPLSTEERNTRARLNEQEHNDPEPTTDTANNDDVTKTSAIHNTHFPTFKLLRKINNKYVTAQHHLTFLTNLQLKGQVPRGLQVKSAPTGAELDHRLYKEWEEAHINLANSLRDILIRHWTNTSASLTIVISEITDSLKLSANEEQWSLILQLIEKANNAKIQELATRRRRKENTRERTATLGGGRPPPPPGAAPAAPIPQQ